MDIDINSIIDKVAERHHVRLAPDDPVMTVITATQVVHDIFAEHLRAIVKDVANQATDRLAAEIEAGRREVVAQTDAAKAAVSAMINTAGSWSADKLREAAAGAATDVEAAGNRLVASAEADARTARGARQVAVWSAAGGVVLLGWSGR
jgi:hypothetical protein